MSTDTVWYRYPEAWLTWLENQEARHLVMVFLAMGVATLFFVLFIVYAVYIFVA
jgi:hypothetical protein